MNEEQTENIEPRQSIIAADSPLRQMTAEQLLLQLEDLIAAHWNIKIETDKLVKQNNLLQDTILNMINAVKVLKGSKGQYVANHVTNIVVKAIGKIQSGDYSPKLDDCFNFIEEIRHSEELPNDRLKLVLDAEISLKKLKYFLDYNRLSDEDKKKLDDLTKGQSTIEFGN